MRGMKLRAGWLAAAIIAMTAVACERAPAEPEPPRMAELLYEAWERVASEHGRAVADSMFAPLQRRNAALRTAFRSREISQVRAAQEELYYEQVGLVAGVLGVPAARRVLDPVSRMLERRTARLQQLREAGRPVAHMEPPLREATTLRDRAEQALAAGDAAGALDLALRAADQVMLVRPDVGTAAR
jgi:hypothetical protein